MSEYKFDDLPRVVATLVEEIKGLKLLVEDKLSVPQAEPKATWMTMTEFRAFHPEHPAATTVYGWVRNGLIPHYKKGKKLFFKRSEIETWLDAGRQQTEQEIEDEADAYINRRRIGK